MVKLPGFFDITDLGLKQYFWIILFCTELVRQHILLNCTFTFWELNDGRGPRSFLPGATRLEYVVSNY